MSLAQRMDFLLDLFKRKVVALVINHYHINGLHLFWDTLYIRIAVIMFSKECSIVSISFSLIENYHKSSKLYLKSEHIKL